MGVATKLRFVHTAERCWIWETAAVARGWRVLSHDGVTPCADHAHATPEDADRCYRRAMPSRGEEVSAWPG